MIASLDPGPSAAQCVEGSLMTADAKASADARLDFVFR
jgi:hypothetical protein